MSSDDAVTATAPAAQVDANAQAAEDAKRMLAELKAGAKPEAKAETKSEATAVEKTNGHATEEAKSTGDATVRNGEDKENERERNQEGRHRGGDRSFRGGRGRGGFKHSQNYKQNIKSDLTTQEESSDPAAIRKQVEFYFSDSNLPMDKFLLGKVGGSENHPVEIKIIHSFKRMRHFQPFDAIVSALKESTILNLTDNDTCVQRKEPLPESLNNGPDENAVRIFEDRAMPRSVYAKGFGEELPTTQFDIEAFFAPYGPTNAIRLRRSDSKIFKSSVFVEFATEDLQKAFLAVDPQPKYKGKELSIMSKKAYCDGKVDDIKAGKIKPHENRYSRDGRDHKRKRDDEDDRDWRERREDDRKGGFRGRDGRRGGHRGFGSRGGRGDRRDRDSDNHATDNGSKDDKFAASKLKRDSATAAALAKAKAMVDAESKKSEDSKETAAANDNGEIVQVKADLEPKPSVGEAVKTAEANVESKKRGRDDEGEGHEAGAPKMKKVDSKPDTAVESASS